MECGICCNNYDSVRHVPKIFNCGHTICLVCVESLPDRTCPTCRQPITFPQERARNLPTNFELLNAQNLPNQPTAPVWEQNPRNQPTAPVEVIHVIHEEPHVVYVDRPRTPPTNDDDCNQAPPCKLGKKIRHVIVNMHENHINCFGVWTGIFITLSLTRLIAGAAKLGSDCPLERLVAIYLFVKCWFGLLFWTIAAYVQYKNKVESTLKKWVVQLFLTIETTFCLIWFFIGTHWIWTNFSEMKVTCPFYIGNWNPHFINFAVFLHTFDWLYLVLFGIYFLYKLSDQIQCRCHILD